MCLFHCSSGWLETKCEVPNFFVYIFVVDAIWNEKRPGFFFRFHKKIGNLHLVFSCWCNEANIQWYFFKIDSIIDLFMKMFCQFTISRVHEIVLSASKLLILNSDKLNWFKTQFVDLWIHEFLNWHRYVMNLPFLFWRSLGDILYRREKL